ncbi:MAG TPA: outer membrane beta-barrel protein [Mesorhizobium sp.]
MLRLQPRKASHGTGESVRALLLATSVLALTLALTLPVAVKAQEMGLRGEVSESTIQRDQLNGAGKANATRAGPKSTVPSAGGQNGTPVPAYDPASVGAIPDPTGDAEDDAGQDAGTIDGMTASRPDNSAFSDDPVPAAPAPQWKPTDDDAQEEATPLKPGEKPAQSRTAKAKAKAKGKASPAEGDTGLANPDQADQDDPEQQAANLRAGTLDSAEKKPLDRGAERAETIEGLRKKREDDPFAAVGIRAGSFILRPTLEEGVTATSNADSSFNGSSAVLSETTLRLNAISDWKENSASSDGYLTYRKTLSGDDIEDVRGRAEGTLNIDIGHDLRAIAKFGYEAAPESASSPVVIEDTISQPLRQTIDGSLGIRKDVGKARFGLTGAVKHDIYGDAELSSGGTLSQKDRDSTLYTATLRGGYEISPALTPFVEIETGRRLYDESIDTSGYDRSANRLGARAGLELDMGEKLAGEFSAGWLREAIDDDRLAPISGATVNADLKWSPERGTTVGLSGATIVEGTTNPGESGSLLYSSRLSVERQIRDNLTGNAALGVDWRDYVGSNGHDLTLSAEASLTYWLNRYVGLTTRARTEKLTSNLPGREETTNSIFVGLKLQR